MGDTHQRKTTYDVACEIVEVQGGHMARSTCRKDRHSKVSTAKGPRDRRVRLSAHTAIQFYDVQDRLGYDRPSKAVDWLIKKAKSAIDELAELPEWDPCTATNAKTQTRAMQNLVNENCENPIRIAKNRRAAMMENHFFTQNLQRNEMEENRNRNGSSSFLPPSSHSDSLVDVIKSFFPLGASAMAVTPSSPVPLQSYQGDFSTRNGQHREDLQLSLQSLHGHGNYRVLFSETAPPMGGFDEYSELHNHPVQELNQFQRMFSWNCAETDTGNGNEFVFSSSPLPTIPPSPVMLKPFSGESQSFSHRGPLQSSNTSILRVFPVDPIPFDNQIPAYLHQHSLPSLELSSNGISRFIIPARNQGEEENDGISVKPSSASSDSRH